MLNGTQLADEVLKAIGGKQTKARRRAFVAMCNAIVLHIQTQGMVVVPGVQPGGGTGFGKVT